MFPEKGESGSSIREMIRMNTVLIEQTAKNIKIAEAVVLAVLFRSIAAGLGGMYLSLALVDARMTRREDTMCEHCIDCFFRDEEDGTMYDLACLPLKHF